MVNYLRNSELDKARVIFAMGEPIEALSMFMADGYERSLDDVCAAFGLTAEESLKLIRKGVKMQVISRRHIGDDVFIKGDHFGVLRARKILKKYAKCI